MEGTLSEAQLDVLYKQFQEADLDGDGTIDPFELQEFVSNLTGKEISVEDLRNLTLILDRDENGSIDFEEFIQGDFWAI